MRIISQNGNIDIPYELVIIVLENNTDNNYNNYAQGTCIWNSDCDNHIPLASYSTKSNAEKVFEIL